MKKIFTLTIIFSQLLVFGQKKKPGKIHFPPPVMRKEAPPVKVKNVEELIPEERKKCFIYKTEEQKDSLLYISENLLEYGWASDNARMVITTYNYNPIEKKETEKDGRMLFFPTQKMQFINGSYKTEKDILIFTPEKADRFEKRTFRLIYKPKTKKIDYLKDEKNNQFISGDCLQPMMGA